MARVRGGLLLLVLVLPLAAGCVPKAEAPWVPNIDTSWMNDTDTTWGLGKNRLAKAPDPAAADTKSATGSHDAIAAPQQVSTQPLPDSQGPLGKPVLLLPDANAGGKAVADAPVVAPPAPPPAPDVAALPENLQDRTLILADRARRSGDGLTAASLYRQVLADRPDDLEAHLGLAHVLLDAADIDGARPIAVDLQKQFPQNDRIMALMVRLDIASGNLSSAAGRLAIASSLAPNSRDVLLMQGLFEDARGNHAIAQRAYRQILSVAPDDAATNNLALSMMAEGDPAGAATILEHLADDPTASSATVRHNLALAYGLMGREKDAQRLLAQDLSSAAVDSNLKFYRMLRARHVAADASGGGMPKAIPAKSTGTP